MRNMKRFAALMLTAAMSVTFVSGCGSSSGGSTGGGSSKEAGTDSSSSEGGSASSNGTLKFGCFDYSESLDPAATTNSGWATMRYGVGECLFTYADDMTIQNNICDKVESSDDHVTWTLHIKDGVKFSNGTEVTPKAVIDCWEYLYKNKDSATPEKMMDYKSLKDDGKGNVVVELKAGIADLTKQLAYPYFEIIDVNAENANIAENPIGTGPYVITEYTPKQSVKLEKNKNYWKEGGVPYDNVEITLINDDTTKAMALQNGDINLVENITTAADLDALKNDDNFKVNVAQGVRCGFSYMNQKGVLKNEKLRQAIIMAMDDETLCSVSAGGLYTPGYSVLPSNLAYGYDKLKDPYAFDIEKAKKTLDDAGIKDGDGDGIREIDGKNISLKWITYENRCLQQFAEAIQPTLKDELGINVKIESSDADSEWNKMVAGDYDLCSSNWTTVGNGDPTEYLANWYSKGEADYCAYKNDKFDKLYEDLKAEFDDAKRAEIIEQLQQIIIDDAAVLVHGYYNSSMSCDSSIADPVIHTADYYWITNEIKPAS